MQSGIMWVTGRSVLLENDISVRLYLVDPIRILYLLDFFNLMEHNEVVPLGR